MDQENNKFHALQLFTDTFSAETVHLTNEAVGIYIRLLCFAWTKNAKPFKTESAYRICSCKSKECEAIVDLVLYEFFRPYKDSINLWTHKRLVQEHEYLTAKYKKKSISGKIGAEIRWKKSANSTKIAPIPIPSPIPNKNIQFMFEKFWSLISHKKGSKFLASKRYAVQCSEMEPDEIALAFNRYASTVKDMEYLAHVSTWINQRRFEDETNNKTDINNVISRLVKLGYIHKGRKGNLEKFSKDSKNYSINRSDADSRQENSVTLIFVLSLASRAYRNDI